MSPALTECRSKQQATPTSSSYIDILAKAVTTNIGKTTPSFQDPNDCGIKPNSNLRQSNERKTNSPLTPRWSDSIKSADKAESSNKRLIEGTPVIKGGQSAPSKLHMMKTVDSVQQGGAQLTNQKTEVGVEDIVKQIVPKIEAEKVTESAVIDEGKVVSDPIEMRKLRQAQRKEEWKKKHGQQSEGGGVKEESDGYDLSELVSEGT